MKPEKQKMISQVLSLISVVMVLMLLVLAPKAYAISNHGQKLSMPSQDRTYPCNDQCQFDSLEGREIREFHQLIGTARSNHENAKVVVLAKQCMDIEFPDEKNFQGSYLYRIQFPCVAEYVGALLAGQYIQKDEKKAFDILNSSKLLKTDNKRDSETPALYLAELYADGKGTKRDLVMAYALARRSDMMDMYMWTNDVEFADRRNRLKNRLEGEMTPQQIKEANARVYALFPELAEYDRKIRWIKRAIYFVFTLLVIFVFVKVTLKLKNRRVTVVKN